MIETLQTVVSLNDKLEQTLQQDEPNWEACADWVELRDQILAKIDGATAGLKAELERSAALNQQLVQKMKKAQDDIEQSLVKVNTGKKARASYE